MLATLPFPTITDDLRSSIERIEHGAPLASISGGRTPALVTTGADEIDAALPWGGLPASGLHEIFGDAAATGFATSLLTRLDAVRPGAPILWCQTGRELYGHGLAAFGIDPARLILVHGRTDTELLWAMEEGLATPGLGAVVGMLHKVPPIAGRRLQLAAEDHGAFGLLLRPLDPMAGVRAVAELAATSMALTRWRVAGAPSRSLRIGGRTIGMGPLRWQLELQRCRLSAHSRTAIYSGYPKAWQVEWCNETGDLRVVAALRDGSVEPAERWRAAS